MSETTELTPAEQAAIERGRERRRTLWLRILLGTAGGLIALVFLGFIVSIVVTVAT